MNARHFVLATLVFFSLAPLALAQTPSTNSNGSPIGALCLGTPNECITGAYCNTTVNPSVCASPPTAPTQTSGGNQSAPTQTSGGNPTGSVTLINPLSSGGCNAANTDCLGAFLTNILKFVVRIGSIVVILMLVFVGFKFVTAQGEPGKISEARTMLLWTVVGALILLGAQVIAMGIQATVQALGG